MSYYNFKGFNALIKSKAKYGIHHPMLAIDVENNPKTGDFICAGVYGEIKRYKKHKETQIIEQYFTSQEHLCEYLISLRKGSCLFVFFNLSYDLPFISSIVDTSKTLRVGTRIITAQVKENKIKCWDMANHAKGSLEDWIKYLDMEAKHGITKESFKNLEIRVMSDAKATYHLATFLEVFYYEEMSCPIRATVASNALMIYRKNFQEDLWKRKIDNRVEFERQASYGGRVEVVKRGDQLSYGYDINSCYLSIMSEALIPDMSTSHYIERGDVWRKYWDKDFQMILDCEVEVPYSHIPPLPFHGDDKLLFPYGTWRGTYSSVDLKMAMKYGTKITKVHSFTYYRKSKHYFKDFADFIWEKRREYKAIGNLGMDYMLKTVGNSLFGKFLQRNGASSQYFREDDIPPGVWENRVRQKPFFHNGEVWYQIESEGENALHAFPAVSVFILSCARAKLYDAIMANEQNVIYYDTDSLKLANKAKGIMISDELGDWGFEGKEQLIFHRPKMYGTKRKGVPKRAKLIEDTTKHETWRFNKPIREIEALKTGKKVNKWVEQTKILSKADTKRLWGSWDSNESTPIHVVNGEISPKVETCERCECTTQREITTIYCLDCLKELIQNGVIDKGYLDSNV